MSYELFPAKTFDSLELALGYLERHLYTRYIFPIKTGKKFPPLVRDNLDSNASNDPEQIKRWTAKWPGCNWAVAHKKSRLLVVDVDCNQAKGKVGQQTFDVLSLIYDWPDTEKTITPSGGFHLVYKGQHTMALGENGIGKDIDSPNYTLIPGCRLEDGTSYIGNGVDAVSCPQWIYTVINNSKASSRLGASAASEIVVELDKQENIELAIDYLNNEAKPAVEGQYGDMTTLKTAMYLKDIGISQELGVQLLVEYYNPRCAPPWEVDDLARKMRSAYDYGSLSKVGGRTAEAEFASDPPEEIIPMGDRRTIARQKKERETQRRLRLNGASLDDFYCYLPTNAFIYTPTGDMWPPTSISGRFGKGAVKRLQVSRAVEQATWAPGFPQIIKGKLLANGAWLDRRGASCFNLYRPPLSRTDGDASQAVPWLGHLKKIYPEHWKHILGWFASRVQRPSVKINHCIVMGGNPGIGKDTLLAGLRDAVGPWNFAECNPPNLFETFDASFLQAVVLRINEARDMGEAKVDRYQFYEHTKTLMAAPPETLSVMEKYLKRYSILNLVGVIITTNNKTNGLYLRGDDRRHFVAWSSASESEFDPGYFNQLWDWYNSGGYAHVAALLRSYDLSNFDPKAPPPKTAAFWEIVGANQAPEDGELNLLLSRIKSPMPDAVTYQQIVSVARSNEDDFGDLYLAMTERKSRRTMPSRMERSGYAAIRNPNASDGLWAIQRKRQVVYARASLSAASQLRAVTTLIGELEGASVAETPSRRGAEVDELDDLM